jgi:hypothetical protein
LCEQHPTLVDARFAPAKCVHMRDRRSLAETSLAAETDESRDEESRLKAGCSQDWLPHMRLDRERALATCPRKHELLCPPRLAT